MNYKVQILCSRKNESATICAVMYVIQMFEKILAIVCRTVIREKAVCLKQQCLISIHY